VYGNKDRLSAIPSAMSALVSLTLLSAGDSRKLDAAATLLSAQLREHRISTSTKELRSGLGSIARDASRGFVLLAATDPRNIVGVAYVVSLVSLEHGGISGWLEEFYIAPAWRSQGIGSLLLAETIAAARRLGWKALDLEVDDQHFRAQSLYARHGFHPVARHRFCRRLKKARLPRDTA
jgi:GNAT superfamily N-acetyltransferase